VTSEKIKETLPTDLSGNAWLKEIAYQLAVINEKKPTQEMNGNRPRRN
jgi:hypothetical protein